jgi:hypothetical protein
MAGVPASEINAMVSPPFIRAITFSRVVVTMHVRSNFEML